MSNRTVTKKTGHAKASVGSTVIAETDKWVEVDGNVYFPPDALRREYVGGVEAKATGHSTHCPWKGDASYYTVDVDGKKLENAAWFYAAPFEKALDIKDHVAFYKTNVNVVVD